MTKRKLMIDQDIIEIYKMLTGCRDLPEAANKAPERRGDGRRRGAYYIYTGRGVQSLTGWIMTVDGLEVGAVKVGTRAGHYDITDILSGLLIARADRMDGVPDAVRRVYGVVMDRHRDLQNRAFQTAVKAIRRAYADAPI